MHIQSLEFQSKKLDKEKNPKMKGKLLKKLRMEIGKSRHKLRSLGVDINEDEEKEPEEPEMDVTQHSEEDPKEDLPPVECPEEPSDEQPNGHVELVNGNSTPPPNVEEEEPVNGEVVNGDGVHHEEDDEEAREMPLANGPKIEENGNNIPNGIAHPDINGDEVPEEEIKLDRAKKNKDENVEALQNFQPLDLVWAKCKGYPWYPALIMNPELATQEPLLHGDEELPQPAPDIIELGNKMNSNLDSEIHHLVLFFDQRRTW